MFSINFNLTLSDYGNWSTYLTVNGNYSAITNLASVSSNTVVNGEYIILTMVLNKNITLSTPSTVDGGVTSFRNISVTVNAGSTFTVSSGTTAKFDTVSYQEIESVEGLGTATVTARLKNGSVTLTNEGTLSVQGTLNFTYAEPTTDVNAIVNKGQLIFDGGQFNLNVTVSTGSSKSPLVNGILNENGGTVNVTNGARLNASISSGVSDSALIRNRGTLTIDGASRLNISGTTTTKAYAIHNDSVANITDSFIDASGSGEFYGLFNSNNATATFTVTEVPDYITFPVSATEGYGALYYYLDQIYHIRGTSYSVYNENSFTTVNNVASSGDYTITNGLITGTVKDSAGNVVGIFRDAPLYALIGNIHTQGKVNGQGANASTKLNNITILGNVSNLGTAEISLNNFRLNGNIYNQLSKVLVTGDFMSSDFYYRRSETDTRYYAYYGSSGNKETIEVWNYFTPAIGTNAGGTIYFGPQANKVNFSSTSNYAFYNLTGEMAFANFSNLSSESNPVQIYNQGVFSIDATNADGKVDGMYSLYVKEADQAESLMEGNVGIGNYDTASGISDRGIVNVNSNGYNPASPVTNGMTLTGLHVRNTQNSSAAVTNYAGNLTVNGGKFISQQGNALWIAEGFDGNVSLSGGRFSSTFTSSKMDEKGNFVQVYSIPSILREDGGKVDDLLAKGYVYQKNADDEKNSESALYREISVVPEPGVKYIAADGTEQSCTEYTELTESTNGSAGLTGWYVVKGTVNKEGLIGIAGGKTLNLILCEGATLNLQKTLYLMGGATLNIYGQNGGTGTLIVKGTAGVRQPGIGIMHNTTGGSASVNIYGGTVTAQTDNGA